MARYIHMIRHGEPEEGYVGRFLGRLDPGLSPTGETQARRIAEQVAALAPSRCWVSPLRRANATAGIIAGVCGIPVENTDLLLEIDFGLLEGLTYSEAVSVHPDATDGWQVLSGDFSFPGGESASAFNQRAAGAARLAKSAPEESILLVAHGGILRAILCDLLRVDANDPLRFRLAYAALTTVEMLEGGAAVLTSFNVGMSPP